MRDHVQHVAHKILQTLIIKRQIQHQHGDRFLHRSGAIVAAHEEIDTTRRELRPLEAVCPFTTRCGAAVPLRQVRRVACVSNDAVATRSRLPREARALSGGNIDDVASTRSHEDAIAATASRSSSFLL